MKLTVKTETLQSLVAKSMKGASCNKMIPITSLMAISLDDKGNLELVTTDVNNYLYVREPKVVGEKFYVVVQAEIFSKLISRLTCEDVSLEVVDNILKVTGNGNYSIELPLNEEGELIKFPNPIDPFPMEPKSEIPKIQLSTIKLILSTAKSALSTTNDVPCYTGYYAGKNVIATDTYKICGIDIELLDKPALINPDMMNLFDVMTEEEIKVYQNEDALMFETANCVIYGKVMPEIDDYAVEPISELLSQEFKSSCKVSKSALLQLLDRLSLFVSPYDKNAIMLTFTNTGLCVTSKKASGVETLEYLECNNAKDFICNIDIDMFTTQIKAHQSDSVEIQYGEDNAIKMPDGKITQIVGLLDE